MGICKSCVSTISSSSSSINIKKFYNMDLTKLKTPQNFKDYITFCRFSDVYDGDTATIVFPSSKVKKEIIIEKFRFFGYDAPEIKPKLNYKYRDLEKSAAIRARDYLKHLLSSGITIVKFHNKEKYGRLMGEVYIFDNNLKEYNIEYYIDKIGENNSVKEYMIKAHHAYQYFGDKKLEFHQWYCGPALSI